ncbi:hypothetical protein ACHAPU_007434 [Fusarium lateritium]
MVIGTLCGLGDYLMAVLHWRALILQHFKGQDEQKLNLVENQFTETMCLGQITEGYTTRGWRCACYHVISSLFRDRFPFISLDDKLRNYRKMKVGIEPQMRRSFLQTNLGDHMMGRSFCLTREGRMVMGSGFMLPGDLVVVPLGCSTPILLRPEGIQCDCRFVGDIYVDGYMYGNAIDQWKEGKLQLNSYVLH